MRAPNPEPLRALVLSCAVTLLVACQEGPAEPEDLRFPPTSAAILSTGSAGKDEDPSVLRARDGSLYVAWFSDRTAPGDIYITRSERGAEWIPPVRVTTSAGGDFNPSLIQDSQGVFHLAWFRWTAPFRGHIWYNSSTDGIIWSPANEVQVTIGADVDDWVPTLVEAPDGGLLIYFASAKRTSGGAVTDLYVSRRAPGQSSWSAAAPAGVNSATEHDHLPNATRVGSQVALTWVRHDTSNALPWVNTKSDVYYATSADGRLAWSTPVRVTTEAGRVVNLFPSFYASEAAGTQITWLSTRAGAPELFEQATAQVGQYPNGVTRVDLGAGYSHKIVWTGSPGVYLGLWVTGPDGTQDISYRFFEK